MHFIELNKFKKDYKDLKTGLDRLVSFLNRAYEIDKDKIPKELEEDENIKKAIEKLDIMYLDKEEREIYENLLYWEGDILIIDNLRELSLTSTSKGMLYKCIGNIDECKPFCESYYEQLKLIGEVKLAKVSLDELFNVVDKYKEHLSDYRIECIKYLLKTRYNCLIERGILW